MLRVDPVSHRQESFSWAPWLHPLAFAHLLSVQYVWEAQTVTGPEGNGLKTGVENELLGSPWIAPFAFFFLLLLYRSQFLLFSAVHGLVVFRAAFHNLTF